MAVTPIDWNAGGNTSLQEMLLADKLRAERQGRSRIASLIEPALGGDRAAMAGVFQGSPEMGTRIAQAVGTLELGKQRDLKAYTDFITHGGVGVLSLPPDQQPGAYAALFSEAQQRGYPVQGVPTEWGPQAKAFLTMQVNRAMPLARYFKTQGGGGAPAGGGGSGWGGPPAARVSDAGPPAPGGPMVADAGTPPMPTPTVAQGGGSVAPQPVADLPQPVAQPFAAPAGPMLAQVAPAPPAAPAAQPAPPPVQVAAAPVEGGDVPDDAGDSGRFVGGADAERAFKLQPGESIKIAPKDGKPIVDGGGVWVQARDGSVEWRLLDPAGRPIRVQTVDLGDRIGVIGADGEVVREIPKGRSPNSPTRVQTVDLGDRIGVLGADGEVVREIAKGKPPGQADKPLDNAARDDIKKAAAPAHAAASLLAGFKDEYGGSISGWAGDVENLYRRNRPGGDPGGQAQWWQEYNTFANEVRHGLFGASLTEGEKKAFDAAMINPGMDPREIRANLTRQRHIMAVALARTAHGMREGGTNPRAIEAQAGLTFNNMADPFNQPGIEAGDAPSRFSPGGPQVPAGGTPPSAPPGAVPAGRAQQLRSKYGLD